MPTIRERNGTFNAQVRLKAGGVIVHQESATFSTYTQAKLWGETLEQRLRGTPTSANGHTVADLMEKYEVQALALGRHTDGRINGAAAIKALRCGSLAKKVVVKVTTSDITKWAMDYSQGRAPASVLIALMTLRSAFRMGITMHDMPLSMDVVANAVNRMTHLGVAQRSIGRERRVTDAEIDRIGRFHENLHGSFVPVHFIATLAVALPRRVSELTSMTWEDYDGSVLQLWDTKNPNKTRNETIPVPPAAQRILATLPRSTGVILPYVARSVGQSFIRASKNLGIPDLRFHDLRHEGVSRLFAQGLDIPEVSLISGHTSWATLKRYTHLKPQDVLDKLNARSQRTQETPPEPQ